jgi:hypothetical protein
MPLPPDIVPVYGPPGYLAAICRKCVFIGAYNGISGVCTNGYEPCRVDTGGYYRRLTPAEQIHRALVQAGLTEDPCE